MTRINATDARRDFGDVLNRVAYGGERIVLHRRGRNAAVLISPEDYALLEKLEDEYDIKRAEKALKSTERIPYELVRKKLNLE